MSSEGSTPTSHATSSMEETRHDLGEQPYDVGDVVAFTDQRVEVQRDGCRLPKSTQNTWQNSRN